MSCLVIISVRISYTVSCCHITYWKLTLYSGLVTHPFLKSPALEPPMSTIPSEDDANRGTTLIVTLTILITIATVMVFLRLYVRSLVKSLGLDDLFILLSLVGMSGAALIWPQLILKCI